MAVESSFNKVQYSGNGSARDFPITFSFVKDEHIKPVILSPQGAATWLDGGYEVQRLEGGTANLVYPVSAEEPPLPLGWLITIYRIVPYRQNLDLADGGRFNANEIESALDNIVFQIQQLAESDERNLQIPPGSPGGADPNDVLNEVFIARDEAQSASATAGAHAGEADASKQAAASSEQGATEKLAETQEIVNHLMDEVQSIADSFLSQMSTVKADSPGLASALGTTIGAVAHVADDGEGGSVLAYDGLLTVAAPVDNVISGVSTTENRLEALTPESHAASHRTTRLNFTEHSTFTPEHDCVVTGGIFINGGYGGGSGRGGSGTSDRIGVPGYNGNFAFPKGIHLSAGVTYAVNIGAGGVRANYYNQPPRPGGITSLYVAGTGEVVYEVPLIGFGVDGRLQDVKKAPVCDSYLLSAGPAGTGYGGIEVRGMASPTGGSSSAGGYTGGTGFGAGGAPGPALEYQVGGNGAQGCAVLFLNYFGEIA